MKELNNNSKWRTHPKTKKWGTETNWKPSNIPTKKAIFSKSSKTLINFSKKSKAIVESIEFTPEAPSFNFTIRIAALEPALTISGVGIVNNSKRIQCFNVQCSNAESKGIHLNKPQLKFSNSASAGGSDIAYYAGPESLENGYGGGIIGFVDLATAGEAIFTIRTGAVPPAKKNSTVGAEVSFSNSSSAGKASFTIYGTLGTDGDTFGNIVFHDEATADQAVFTNIGGTVPGGDGGNTQFYDESTAADGVYNNYGGNVQKSNGGDVAFDGIADGGQAHFYNHAAMVSNAYGGVTSFNNNPPMMNKKGTSAGFGSYHNYGASKNEQGGGGHTEFTAKYGCPTAGNATIYNYGSVLEDYSSAGHTIFSISLPTENFPTAGNALFYNYPGSLIGSAVGFTEFSVYDSGIGSNVPTAGNATFINLGGNVMEANGGYTKFSKTTTAENAKLIANGGINGGYGGQIIFSDDATGGSSSIHLIDNGKLDISLHNGGLTIGELTLQGGIISTNLGTNLTCLNISKKLMLESHQTEFTFLVNDNSGFEFNTPYVILTAVNLSEFKTSQFKGTMIQNVPPKFTIVEKGLLVSFDKF
jgi:hypothetical protein